MLIDIYIIMRVFIKKSAYQISINREKTTTNKVPTQALWEFSISSLSLLVKSFEEEIQPFEDYVDTAKG